MQAFGSLWGHVGHMMAIGGGVMGPKSENVGFSSVLPLLFEGSRGPRGRQGREQHSEPRGKSKIFVKKCFVVIFRIELPTAAGSTFS